MKTDEQVIKQILRDLVDKTKDVDKSETLQSIAEQLKDAAFYCTRRLNGLDDEYARPKPEGGYGVVFPHYEPKDIIPDDEYDRLSSALNDIFESDYLPPIEDFSQLPRHITYLSVFFQLSEISNIPEKTLLVACERAMNFLSFASLLAASATTKMIDMKKAANRKKSIKSNKKRKRVYFEKLSEDFQKGTNSSRAKNIYKAWKREYEASANDTPKPYKPDHIRKLFG